MTESRVLVAGATGQLGSVITRKLIASGATVRALARDAAKLAAFAPQAEIAAVDMRDVPKLTEACRGVDQIIATANNNMGKGEKSPTRTDLGAYQNLCAAARNTGVRRLIYVSYRGVTLASEPAQTEWGTRAFDVKEPSGFLITISSPEKK